MMTPDELRHQLQGVKKRKKDAFVIIGAVSGLGEKTVKEIASGKREPSLSELHILGALAQ